jgi:hypothetical protein
MQVGSPFLPVQSKHSPERGWHTFLGKQRAWLACQRTDLLLAAKPPVAVHDPLVRDPGVRRAAHHQLQGDGLGGEGGRAGGAKHLPAGRGGWGTAHVSKRLRLQTSCMCGSGCLHCSCAAGRHIARMSGRSLIHTRAIGPSSVCPYYSPTASSLPHPACCILCHPSHPPPTH